jgi:hypothetical protein
MIHGVSFTAFGGKPLLMIAANIGTVISAFQVIVNVNIAYFMVICKKIGY